MSKLSVNINKIATLRNARGGNVPNVLNVALDCEKFGAEGITVHPRPDERHIRYSDVYSLTEAISTEFNIEGYPNKKFIDLVLDVKPQQVTLVPDPPNVLTSNSGWDTIAHAEFLKPIISRFKEAGIRTSIFMGTEEHLIEHAVQTGTDRIELYTGPYADQYHINKEEAVKAFSKAERLAQDLGLGVNAGHDLDLFNLKYFKQQLPNLLEVSIGHALISDAIYLGLESTIHQYLKELS